MEPEKLAEALRDWVVTTETLLELVPEATPQQLLDYAKGVISSPVAAVVLSQAMAGLAAAPAEPAPTKRPLGVRR